MMRADPWRRWITREHAAVWNPGGRFGPRRVRVNECWHVLKAENLGGRKAETHWEIVQNAVWRRGRVFLRCPRCSGRCTRLYLPLETSWLACRKCWGLTYPSRALQNYKNTRWGGRQFAWMFGTTQRDWALMTTNDRRKERRRRSRDRWNERRHVRAGHQTSTGS